MSESKPLILNTTSSTKLGSSSTKPTERDVVLGVVAGLLPALHQWRAQWQAAHPKQTVTSVYVTAGEESTK